VYMNKGLHLQMEMPEQKMFNVQESRRGRLLGQRGVM